MFARYLRERHGLTVDLLEQESTNCGNNVTNALQVLAEAGIAHQRLVLVQDATMQQRMDAGFRRAAPSTRIINFASHQTRVAFNGKQIEFVDEPAAIWTLERYVSLLLLTATSSAPARGDLLFVQMTPGAQRAVRLQRDAMGLGGLARLPQNPHRTRRSVMTQTLTGQDIG